MKDIPIGLKLTKELMALGLPVGTVAVIRRVVHEELTDRIAEIGRVYREHGFQAGAGAVYDALKDPNQRRN